MPKSSSLDYLGMDRNIYELCFYGKRDQTYSFAILGMCNIGSIRTRVNQGVKTSNLTGIVVEE